MKMKMKLLAAAISAIGAVGVAQAAVQAQAILNVTNVLFYNDATNTVLDVSNFVPAGQPGGLFISDSTNLNPCVGATCNAYNNTVFGGSPLPLTVRTVGAPPVGNDFLPATPPPGADGAKAASALTNNPITGLPNPSNGGSDAQASSLAQRVTNGNANTTASLTLSSQFTFTLTSDTKVRFEFDGYKYLLAYTDTPINAIAGIGWNMSITDVTILTAPVSVFDWTPNGAAGGITGGVENADPCSLTDSVTAIYPASVSPGQACATGGTTGPHFSATSDLLKSGTTYQLSINHQTQAVVNQFQPAPEPSSLLLAGLALVGLGFGARRKARQAT